MSTEPILIRRLCGRMPLPFESFVVSKCADGFGVCYHGLLPFLVEDIEHGALGLFDWVLFVLLMALLLCTGHWERAQSAVAHARQYDRTIMDISST
ncbi:uncharacterized protein F5147DRAFT_90227 [Suillus discolor]|uniref:Uncharacterized protein n=1 Tax=Suillus discolor TaxID=1912936 RepID=A0A9P7JVY2_9AGAM|nr:uncharacterized protein F5147DRAFT_90227 [Suillus discolor]KAG2111526.1 hypothetical protein F5147DRAFT_90227 [Suillus discolor]